MDHKKVRAMFSSVGIMNITDEILFMCENLCTEHFLDDCQELVDAWTAYSFSTFSENKTPTVETLNEMAKKTFTPDIMKTPKQIKTNKRKEHFKNKNNSLDDELGSTNLMHMDLKTNSANKINSSFLEFSPVNQPLNVTPKIKKNTNIASGESLSVYGDACFNWKSSHTNNFTVEECFQHDNSSWKYMSHVLYDTWNLHQDYCEYICEEIIKCGSLPEPIPFWLAPVDNSTFVGRVCAERRINSQSVTLEGIGTGAKEKIEVDFSQAGEFSLFPGQVLAFNGVKDGKQIIATKLYTSGKGTIPPAPVIMREFQMVVAAGPFTESDQLNYEALNVVIKYVEDHKPEFLFLIGPLIDVSNQEIIKGNIPETIADFHKNLLKKISDSLKVLPTKVFLVASHKDAINLPIYPTPPTNGDNFLVTGSTIQYLPDPTVLKINGMLIALTSVDSLLHLSKVEVSNCKSNRLARLAGHLINQQTFYPICPSDLDIGVDLGLWEKYARLPQVPHIMILPSDLHHFIKNVEDCLVINPEKCVKGLSTGAFVHIEVGPSKTLETLEPTTPWASSKNISAKIIKI